MRYLAILLLPVLVSGCSSSHKARSVASLLDGNWKPVQQEIGGKALPATLFQSQKLLIKDSTYTLSAESVDKGILSYKKGQMDIYGKEGVNKGKHFTALYKLENDQLTIVYNLKGDGYPAGFETKSKPALFLSVFKKE